MSGRSRPFGIDLPVAMSATRMPMGETPRPSTYEDAVRFVRALDPAGGVGEVVRAATLAANSHNTQPWRFALTDGRITIHPDFDRRARRLRQLERPAATNRVSGTRAISVRTRRGRGADLGFAVVAREDRTIRSRTLSGRLPGRARRGRRSPSASATPARPRCASPPPTAARHGHRARWPKSPRSWACWSRLRSS